MIRLLSIGTWKCCYCCRGTISCFNDYNSIRAFRNLRRENIVSIQHCSYVTPSNKDIESGKWYPKHISDLDYICDKVVMCDPNDFLGSNANHPIFEDEEYMRRRKWFLNVANNYKQGAPIPRIEYTMTETKTWRVIYRDLKTLHNKFACEEFLNNFKLLEKHCGYSDNQIPQLEDISNYLKSKTGFTLRPCGGYLTPRNFLAALAFRVFCCTQYMRHHTDPHYTPEPDTCHELLGHMAMFLDPVYAQLSQEIGLASLGSSEEICNALIRLYFYTFEFGLLVDGEKFDEKKRNLKIYGAGLLSCVDELKFSVSPDAKIFQFEPDHVIKLEPELNTFQKCYFYSDTINEAFDTIKSYISRIEKPFSLHYNPITQSVEKTEMALMK